MLAIENLWSSEETDICTKIRENVAYFNQREKSSDAEVGHRIAYCLPLPG